MDLRPTVLEYQKPKPRTANRFSKSSLHLFMMNSPLDKKTWQNDINTQICLTLSLLLVCTYPFFNPVVISKLLGSTADMAQEERRILVAVDEGEESLHALSWCLKNLLFQNSKDALILLYVKPPRVVYSTFDGTGYLFSSDVTAAMERYGQEVADVVLEKAMKLCNSVEKVITCYDKVYLVETRVENGDPRDVICEMVQKLGADVLVMGSHGYGLIKRAFLGSVSNHCAQNAKCPVLIVKKPKPAVGNQ
ncbi:uncharacterized protein HKW66_Vig0235790 [Vigna angularis]|uniref:UspA domain-containing protein n=1 Tax=Phaseolus angularis TaxID=3914 RepID=A0A8T0KTA6_PHAAN|nr:uncharacterized protein HKW66_Vig0235790 [Vigna angularis]